MSQILVAIIISTWTIPSTLFTDPVPWPATKIAAVQDSGYDYKSLAVLSILNSAQEAAKLSDIEQRVRILVASAELLPAAKRDEATRLLDVCLHDLKEWVRDEKLGQSRRFTAAKLRSEVLSVYAKLDLDKAMEFQKEDRTTQEDKTATDDSTTALRVGGKWTSEILARRGPADQMAKIALSIVDTDPAQASALVIQSVKEGVVSNALNAIFQKLQQSGKREQLNKLQLGVGQALANTMTLDPYSLGYAASTVFDDDMPTAARAGFIRYFINSLESWAALVKGDDGKGGLDPSYVGSSFTRFFLNVRPAIVKYSPDEILRLDVLLDQVSPFVPDNTKSTLQAFKPETSADPKERLNDIMKTGGAEQRDLRLIRLISDLLRKRDAVDSQKEKDLAFLSDAVSQFSDQTLKGTYRDYLAIVSLNSLVKMKKFIDAQHLAMGISSEATRAWAMLALAASVRQDRVLSFELTSNALKILETVSPSFKKVDLALMAAAMLAKSHPQRSFETLFVASKYANSSREESSLAERGIASALRLEATIGELTTVLASEPESLSEIRIDPALAPLAKSDWFRAQNLAEEFREPSLRLSLRLQFAESVLTEFPKPKTTGRQMTKPLR